MNAVQKQAVAIALALSLMQSSKETPEKTSTSFPLPKANLRVCNASECYSLFMSRVNTKISHDQILTELISHALKEMSSDSLEDEYQENISRTFVQSLTKAEKYYERYLSNYSELCTVMAYKNLNLLKSSAVNYYFFELYDSPTMYQRLNAFCEVFNKAYLGVLSDYDCELQFQEAQRISLQSLHLVPKGDIESALQSIELVCVALRNGQQAFKEWLLQSVAVAVDSAVNKFPTILEGLVQLARSLE